MDVRNCMALILGVDLLRACRVVNYLHRGCALAQRQEMYDRFPRIGEMRHMRLSVREWCCATVCLPHAATPPGLTTLWCSVLCNAMEIIIITFHCHEWHDIKPGLEPAIRNSDAGLLPLHSRYLADLCLSSFHSPHWTTTPPPSARHDGSRILVEFPVSCRLHNDNSRL